MQGTVAVRCVLDRPAPLVAPACPVAFFDLVLELHLGEADKQDLVAFLRVL